MGRQESAEAIVACRDRAAKGRTWSAGRQADGSMVREYAEGRVGKPGARSEGSGRKPREQDMGALSTAAPSVFARPEAEDRLLEAILDRENMMAAYHRVVANGGAAGVDGMTVDDLKAFLVEHWPRIRQDLLIGRYRPQPVRRVDIPKPGGGSRTLGIPTVLDRLIQQAMHQVLSPLFDPDFSEASYGFRPGRSAHQAVLAARAHVAAGRRWVVDLDLEKFLDRSS